MCTRHVAAYRNACTSDLRQAFLTEIRVVEIVPLIFQHPMSVIYFHICQMHILFCTTAMHITLPFVRWLSVPRQDTEPFCTCTSGRGKEEHHIQLKRRREFRQTAFNNGPRIWPVTRNSSFALAKHPILIILMSMRNQGLCFSSYLKNSNSYSTRQLHTLQCQSQGEKPPLQCLRCCATSSPCQF